MSAKRVAIGLSGGVDSTVAAYLLCKQGYEVVGVTMRFYPQENRCCDRQGLYQAQRLCARLSIPHYVIDVEEEFSRAVVDYFVKTYLRGLTPNPCVVCNQKIKFGILKRQVAAMGVGLLATGHYVRLIPKGEYFLLGCGYDTFKSQEYFLAMVDPQVLKTLLFPLGEYTKTQVKKIAHDEKLVFAERAESQDICFVPDNEYSEFIKHKISDTKEYSGIIQHVNGKILGEHKGRYQFTYGQRQGLGIAWNKPLYVVDIDARTNTVIVGEKEHILKNYFFVNEIEWFFPVQEDLPFQVKTRYNAKLVRATFQRRERGYKINVEEKISIPAPGQLAVFYLNNMVVGAGWIERERKRDGYSS